jgi:polyisoprenoid-binding protein YceI
VEELSVPIIRTLLLLCLTATHVVAQGPQRTIPDAVVREGKLSFDGRATAGNFTGTTTTVTGKLQGGQLSQVRGWVEAPVGTLSTGNHRRDRDLNKSMESGKYPTIRFELTDVAGTVTAGDSVNLMLHGRFTIHGLTRDATVPASVAFHPHGIRVRGGTPLNLKDYKIGGLSKALGILKMEENIVIHVDLLFEAASPQRAAAGSM